MTFKTYLLLLSLLTLFGCGNKSSNLVDAKNKAVSKDDDDDEDDDDSNQKLEKADTEEIMNSDDSDKSLEEKSYHPKNSYEQKGILQRLGTDRVYFGFDLDSVDSLADVDKAFLNRLIEDLKNNADLSIEIQGNCDIRGSYQYNIALGARRANTIANYLKKNGIDSHRISVISLGSKVLHPGDNEEAYAKNRVAIIVVK